MIEPQAARLAAERATKAEIEEMAAAFAAMEAAEVPGQLAINADLRFHRAVLAGRAQRAAAADGDGDRRRPEGQLPDVERDVPDLPAAPQERARRDRRPAARGGARRDGELLSETQRYLGMHPVPTRKARGRRPIAHPRRRAGMAEGFPSFDLDGQVVLVTAAARGLGRACALACANAGADIALGLRDKASGKALADEIAAMGRRVAAAADGHAASRPDPRRDRRGASPFRQDRRAGEQCRRQSGSAGGRRAGRRLRLHGPRQPEGHVLREPGGRAADDRSAATAASST